MTTAVTMDHHDTLNQIKTRFLIISDTHSASLSQNSTTKDVAFRPPLPKADVLLHCGDLTMIGLLEEYERTLGDLESIEADLKLVIAGNHDISLDEAYYARKGSVMQGRQRFNEDLPQKAKELWTGERARKAGVVYLEEGTYSFTLKNGARLRVYASPYQPAFCDWAFPYHRNQDRYNLPSQCKSNTESIAQHPIPDFPNIDVLMTHGPPFGVLDLVGTGEKVGCENLLRAARRCKPKLHCFGHIHEGWGAQKVTWEVGDGPVSDSGQAAAESEEASVEAAHSHSFLQFLRRDKRKQNPPEANMGGQCETHIVGVEDVLVECAKAAEQRAARVDIGHKGDMAVEFGKETLMVNASIMTLSYEPKNAPWLVDVDLERADV